MLDKIVVRRLDNSIYEPSTPDGYNAGNAFADMLSGKPSWYFREIVEVPKKWWHRKKRYTRTGKTWEPQEGKEFKVLTI